MPYKASGTLTTATKSFSSPQKPNLSGFAYNLNGQSATVDVVGSPGTSSEERITVPLDGSTSYSIHDQWSDAHTDFRLEFSLSSDGSDTPVIDESDAVVGTLVGVASTITTSSGSSTGSSSLSGTSTATTSSSGTSSGATSVSGGSTVTVTATGDSAIPVAATTYLPDAQQPTLGNGVEDEVAVTIADVTNYGDYRVQIRETGASAWDSSAVGFQEAVLASDSDTSGSVSTTFGGLEDGEEYEVRARTETEHVVGEWTDAVAIIAKFPGVTQVSVASTTADSVTLDAQDNADNETGIEVWRAKELDPARDTGFSSFTQIEDLDPQSGAFQYTDSGLEHNHDYRYFFVPYTEHTSAQSNTAAATTDVAYQPGWMLELRRADGEILTLSGGDLVTESYTYSRKPTAIASWNVSIPRTPVIEEWLESEAYWWYNGDLVLRGPLHRHEGYEALHGKGLNWLLKQGGTSRRFQNTEGWAAARDYIDEETEFTPVATEPSANVIESGKTTQDAETGDELASLIDTSNIRWTRDGSAFRPGKQCFTRTGISRDADTGLVATTNDPDAIDGAAVGIGSSSDSLRYDETVEHHIPESEVGAKIRLQPTNDAHSTEYVLVINDVEHVLGSRHIGVEEPVWFDLIDEFGYNGGDLQPGDEVSMLIRGGSDDTTGQQLWDCLTVVYDKRAEADLNFANTLNSNGQLPGPEYYAPATQELSTSDQAYNIIEANANASIDDTTGDQRIELSLDGSTWLPDDGSESNTTAVTADFDAAGIVGTDITPRITLDGYGSDPTETPVHGRQPQKLTAWELSVTMTSLGVIDDRRYTGNHFENMQSLAEDAGVIFIPRMKDGVKEMEIFAPGDVTDTIAPDGGLDDKDVQDHNRVLDREQYANVQTVYGATNPDTGEPYEATVESTSEIEEYGRVEAPPVTDNRLDSTADVQNKAAQELAKRIAARDVTGWMDLIPEFAAQVTPGKAYSPTYGDFQGEELVLQDLSYSDLRDAQLNFEDPEDVAAAIALLSGQLKQTRDAL